MPPWRLQIYLFNSSSCRFWFWGKSKYFEFKALTACPESFHLGVDYLLLAGNARDNRLLNTYGLSSLPRESLPRELRGAS